MRFSTILFILFIIGGVIFLKGKIHRTPHFSREASPVSVVGGNYVSDSVIPGVPRLSLHFLDEHRVQMLGDNKPWGRNGGMCRYEIRGDVLELTHFCGVWRMKIKGPVLHSDEIHADFRFTGP